jgi:hypothetical protein
MTLICGGGMWRWYVAGGAVVALGWHTVFAQPPNRIANREKSGWA